MSFKISIVAQREHENISRTAVSTRENKSGNKVSIHGAPSRFTGKPSKNFLHELKFVFDSSRDGCEVLWWWKRSITVPRQIEEIITLPKSPHAAYGADSLKKKLTPLWQSISGSRIFFQSLWSGQSQLQTWLSTEDHKSQEIFSHFYPLVRPERRPQTDRQLLIWDPTSRGLASLDWKVKPCFGNFSNIPKEVTTWEKQLLVVFVCTSSLHGPVLLWNGCVSLRFIWWILIFVSLVTQHLLRTASLLYSIPATRSLRKYNAEAKDTPTSGNENCT